MERRLFQILIVNLGLAIVYAIQKKVAWKIATWVDDAVLRGKYEQEHRFVNRRRPYPTPRHKNLYYRPKE